MKIQISTRNLSAALLTVLCIGNIYYCWGSILCGISKECSVGGLKTICIFIAFVCIGAAIVFGFFLSVSFLSDLLQGKINLFEPFEITLFEKENEEITEEELTNFREWQKEQKNEHK